MTEAGLWTDGRYFVQAARQLEGTTITLYRMGEEGVPTVNEYIEKVLKQGETIGFDGRVVNARWGARLEEIAAKKKAFKMRSGKDVWKFFRNHHFLWWMVRTTVMEFMR